MVGLLLWNQGNRFPRPVHLREVSVLHVRFLCAAPTRGAQTPAGVQRRRHRAAGKKLLRQGVERVVRPRDAPQDALPEGLRPAGTLPLRRAMAADWCGELLRLRGENPAAARVLVTADALSGEVVRTVTELALRHRWLLLNCAAACGGNTACPSCCTPQPENPPPCRLPSTRRSGEGRVSCRCTTKLCPCRDCCCRRNWKRVCRRGRTAARCCPSCGKWAPCGRDRCPSGWEAPVNRRSRPDPSRSQPLTIRETPIIIQNHGKLGVLCADTMVGLFPLSADGTE